MRKTLSIIALSLALTGCTNGPSDPLLDAPLGNRTVCTAVNPVQGSDVLSVVPFNCPDLEISATLNELRDDVTVNNLPCDEQGNGQQAGDEEHLLKVFVEPVQYALLGSVGLFHARFLW